jgi:hypothetical protein
MTAPAERAAPSASGGAAVTYLIIGVDRDTHAPWHWHVLARSIAVATGMASARAAAHGIVLVIAAVIGPNSAVIPQAESAPGDARLTAA